MLPVFKGFFMKIYENVMIVMYIFHTSGIIIRIYDPVRVWLCCLTCHCITIMWLWHPVMIFLTLVGQEKCHKTSQQKSMSADPSIIFFSVKIKMVMTADACWNTFSISFILQVRNSLFTTFKVIKTFSSWYGRTY